MVSRIEVEGYSDAKGDGFAVLQAWLETPFQSGDLGDSAELRMGGGFNVDFDDASLSVDDHH